MEPLRWVLQQHMASRLHCDLRLEVGGVAVSWAVPRGPSLDPRVRRLAQRVPDHALDQLDREGVEGPGRATIVWDTGTYTLLGDRSPAPTPALALAAGHLPVHLAGTKLRGGFALHRTDGARWLLVKMRDDEARDDDPDVLAAWPASVRSGRTLAELLASADDPTPAG